jgi:predicted permease
MHTLRALRRAPWYSVTIIGVIALGMTLATTVFAIVDGVLFRPMPYPDAGRLFKIQAGFADITLDQIVPVSASDVAHWNAATPGAAITAFQAAPAVSFGPGVNDYVAGIARVQPNLFDVLQVRPLVGGFTKEDFEQEVPFRPAIITYDLWQSRFLGDPAVVGRTVELDAWRHTGFRVVGIMPRGFSFPSESWEVKFILPMVLSEDFGTNPIRRNLSEVIARAPRSMGANALRLHIEAGMKSVAAVFPPRGPKPESWSDREWRQMGPYDRADVQPLAVTLGSRSGPLFRAVFLAVALLVGLSAINVSGLMAARALDRARELRLRRVLGASPFAICRLVFAETFALVLAGSALGFLFVPPLLRFALTLLPEEIALLKPATIDWRVTAFVSLCAVVLSIPTALWPIRRALKSEGTASPAVRPIPRVIGAGRFVVIAAQVAGAFVLIVTGALLVSSILAVYANDRAIRTEGVVVIDGSLSGPGAGAIRRKSSERPARIAPILDRIRRVPGVNAVGLTSADLLDGSTGESWFARPAGANKARLPVQVQGVTGDYYRVVRPQLIAGRLPTDAEVASNARIVVVGESVARAYWPNVAATGQTIAESDDPEPYLVIGVVRDVRWSSWDAEVGSIYGPYALLARSPHLTVLIEASGQTGQVLAHALRAFREADPYVQAQRAAPLDALFVESVRPRRFQSWLFGSLGVAGLVVVGVGILGLIAMSTARRTKEIGIRYALGSTRGGVVLLILREPLTSVIVGLVAGGLISAWAATLVSSYLYGVAASDVRVWASAATTIVTTAAIGALVPAIKASNAPPVTALRVE